MERLAAESEGAQAAAYGSDVVARACLLQLLAGAEPLCAGGPGPPRGGGQGGPLSWPRCCTISTSITRMSCR